MLGKYSYIDLYCYYVENRIVHANTVHHVVELRDDWDKRLDVGNMFPCSIETHSKIHVMYKKDKEDTQKLLLELIERYKKEFGLT